MKEQRPMRGGDRVVLRSAEEILATLDDDGTLDGLPFMPEMLAFAGRELVVSKRAEKLCDTIAKTGGRRMRDAVHLEDLRCDGSAHGGCQAECLLIWKEAWLEPSYGGASVRSGAEDAAHRLDERARLATSVAGGDGSPPVYRCQATELYRATEEMDRSASRHQYVRELRSGNVSPTRFVRVAFRIVSNKLRQRLGRFHWQIVGRGTGTETREPLELQPGEHVRVRPVDDIIDTLNEAGKNRGLSFDHEMAAFCGGTYRVRRRVQRLIDERTGEMIEPKHDCLILDGVVCSGDWSEGRWFCTRAIYPYWREAWLERVGPHVASTHAADSTHATGGETGEPSATAGPGDAGS
jgi:hypothetical protein